MIFDHYRQGRLEESLWVCHVANLLLGVGLLLKRPLVVQMASLLVVGGLPFWVYDVFYTGGTTAASVISHLLGTGIALLSMKRLGADEKSYRGALLTYLLMQGLSRVFLRPTLNVNLAHQVYPGFDQFVSSYPVYWFLATLLAAGYLWGLGRFFRRLFPGRLTPATKEVL